jgi:hypothetical protein
MTPDSKPYSLDNGMQRQPAPRGARPDLRNSATFNSKSDPFLSQSHTASRVLVLPPFYSKEFRISVHPCKQSTSTNCGQVCQPYLDLPTHILHAEFRFPAKPDSDSSRLHTFDADTPRQNSDPPPPRLALKNAILPPCRNFSIWEGGKRPH